MNAVLMWAHVLLVITVPLTLCRKRAESKTKSPNFKLLDLGGGAGWDLVCKLVTERNRVQRGRLSAAQALQHKFLR